MNERDEIKERVKAAMDLADWIIRDGVPPAPPDRATTQTPDRPALRPKRSFSP